MTQSIENKELEDNVIREFKKIEDYWGGDTYFNLKKFIEINEKNKSKDIDNEISKLGDMFFKNGNYYGAHLAYARIYNEKKLRFLAEECLKQPGINWLGEALSIYRNLGDRGGFWKVANKYMKLFPNDPICETSLNIYVGEQLYNKIHNRFKDFTKENGIKIPYEFPEVLLNCRPINLAHNLAKNYDLGIGIANGGLGLTYMFNLFGLPTIITEAHKADDVTFKWITNPNEQNVKGKRIALFDKDVDTGKTSKRNLDEIKKFSPKSVDLILYHNPTVEGYIGTKMINVSKEFNNIYYPSRVSYEGFDEAVRYLEDKLQ